MPTPNTAVYTSTADGQIMPHAADVALEWH
jgi:hypothetical protein